MSADAKVWIEDGGDTMRWQGISDWCSMTCDHRGPMEDVIAELRNHEGDQYAPRTMFWEPRIGPGVVSLYAYEYPRQVGLP